jgi:hypothetical protein
MYIAQSHLIYLVLSIGLTVWVGRTIHHHGRVFLVDTFAGNESFADAVNALLVVGFYLINIGYVSLTLGQSGEVNSIAQLIEVNSARLGRVLLVLGAMHFFNLYVFSRMRRRALLHHAPPPVSSFERLVHEAAR